LAIAAANAATSFSFFAIPIATPIANNIGKFANTISPHLFNTESRAYKNVPSPNIPAKPYASIMFAFVNEPPIPKNKPATGNMAIGNINERPTLCNTPKILSFIILSLLFLIVKIL